MPGVTRSDADPTERTSNTAVLRARVGAAAQLACLLEASAPKPGNVSPGRHFADSRYEDFLASAAALGEPLAALAQHGMGATVLRAVEATAWWVPSNTNLGIVLLLTPLAHAAHACLARAESGIGIEPGPLRDAVRSQLEATTVDDAGKVYEAVRRAAPGGLGRVDEQDVAVPPSRPLLDVMRLAQARDDIAREYVTGFEITFETAVPALMNARRDRLPWEDATVETFLTVLAARPDTHVRRRAGDEAAADVSRWAARALAAGGVRSSTGRRTIDEMDRALRDPRNLGNPGTTADLTAAAIFVVLLGGGWRV
jgi:triphosphoribosyl-dephospho-CoA synthase